MTLDFWFYSCLCWQLACPFILFLHFELLVLLLCFLGWFSVYILGFLPLFFFCMTVECCGFLLCCLLGYICIFSILSWFNFSKKIFRFNNSCCLYWWFCWLFVGFDKFSLVALLFLLLFCYNFLATMLFSQLVHWLWCWCLVCWFFRDLEFLLFGFHFTLLFVVKVPFLVFGK